MSANNGVIRIGRKGIKQFAFGEEGTPGSEPFNVEIVTAFEAWLAIDNNFRPVQEDSDGNRPVPMEELPKHTNALVLFVESLRPEAPKKLPGYEPVNSAEARDFLARLREAYDELVVFFRPKSRQEQDSQDTSGGTSLQFSEESEEKVAS